MSIHTVLGRILFDIAYLDWMIDNDKYENTDYVLTELTNLISEYRILEEQS